jgi:hypothetical protein
LQRMPYAADPDRLIIQAGLHFRCYFRKGANGANPDDADKAGPLDEVNLLDTPRTSSAVGGHVMATALGVTTPQNRTSSVRKTGRVAARSVGCHWHQVFGRQRDGNLPLHHLQQDPRTPCTIMAD